MNTRLRMSRLVSVFSRGFVPVLVLWAAGSLWSAPARGGTAPALDSGKEVVLVPVVGTAKQQLVRALASKGGPTTMSPLHHECPGVPPDQMPHVQEIACGSSVTDELTSTGSCRISQEDGFSYVDFYGFNGTAGQEVTINLTALFDTYLFLQEPSGMVASFDDDGGEGTNSRIVFTLNSSGTWYIAANSYAANTFGAYNLSLACSGGGGGAPGPAAVVPVVGSTPGASQAFFRTSVQLHNPGAAAVSGRLIYHPQGTSAGASDPSLFYALAPGETRSIPDLLPAMGLTGLGTLDVVPEVGTAVPLIVVRVFNDGGALGTTGFTEELVLPADALGAGQRGVLIGPIDTALYRFNVGVRTLGAGAVLSIVVRNAAGTVTRTLTRTYAPNYFEQRDSGAFLEGAVLAANDTITVQVVSGSAIVYGATVDNRTNDPSLQLARRVP